MSTKSSGSTILALLLLLTFPLTGNGQKNKLVISFENTFGGEPLVLKKEYTNAHGEKVSFTLLNYFISNIKLTRTNGTTYTVPQDSSYFLVREGVSQSKKIGIIAPKGTYRSITFTIGVDSLRSTQGPDKRKGVLDVGAEARGMYWQWNSGYIFFKMEGKSPASPDSLKNSFYYHIGGYGGFDSRTLNNIRVKSIALTKDVRVCKKKTAQVSVSVDAKKFFEAKMPLRVGEHPSIMWGPVSTQIADNYMDIFSLRDITYSKAEK